MRGFSHSLLAVGVCNQFYAANPTEHRYFVFSLFQQEVRVMANKGCAKTIPKKYVNHMLNVLLYAYYLGDAY